MRDSQKRNWLTNLLSWYFSKRVLPHWCVLLTDTLIVFLSTFFVFWISRRTGVMFENRYAILWTALMYSAVSWVGVRLFRTYSGVLRYSSFVDLRKIAMSNGVSMALAVGLSLFFVWKGVPALSALSVIETIAVFVVSTMLQWAMRVVVKTLFEVSNENQHSVPVLIFGVMADGVGLAKYIRDQRPVRFKLEGFLTNEQRIKDMQLMGVNVYTLDEDIEKIIKKLGIKGVLVSPLVANEFRENHTLQDLLINSGCKIYMTQEAREASIKNGELSEEEIEGMQIREVSVEDLLPRQQIRVDMESVAEQISGKRVMITGSAGSIGAEIVRQVASFHPAKMMLIDQAETPQHDIRLMMAREFPEVAAETVVASIDRQTRMENIFESFRPEYVFHAAAYKHVPMMEDNPSEAVMNNVRGTQIIADLSVKYGVRKFVMVSTDKAVNPTNVMGCSKRICEIYVQSLDRKQKLAALSQFKEKGKVEYTQFITTRFGNVLGSNGSVIPLFRKQIKDGGPVTVTDERIVRYFMLIPEACKLMLEAGTKGNGGEIFVFDMGEPVKIADLARRMIALSGAKDVQIEYTGLREGEKLYEEVLSEMENTKPTFHEKIRIAQVREYDFDEVKKEIDSLIEIAKCYDNMATVRKMKEIVPEYKSNNSVYEAIDKEMAREGVANSLRPV